jgi:DNA-binding transcriptional ArsR family regulator
MKIDSTSSSQSAVSPESGEAALQAPALVDFARVLADATRQRIMQLCCCHWCAVGDIVTALDGDVSQPTVSHHLAVLREAGLVNVRREGRHAFYSLNQERVAACCGRLIQVMAPESIAASKLDERVARVAPAGAPAAVGQAASAATGTKEAPASAACCEPGCCDDATAFREASESAVAILGAALAKAESEACCGDDCCAPTSAAVGEDAAEGD